MQKLAIALLISRSQNLRLENQLEKMRKKLQQRRTSAKSARGEIIEKKVILLIFIEQVQTHTQIPRFPYILPN